MQNEELHWIIILDKFEINNNTLNLDIPGIFQIRNENSFKELKEKQTYKEITEWSLFRKEIW